jgi:hypothetical protein
MSRSQSSNISSTAQGNSTADQTAATTAQTAENQDIGNYEQQLSKYSANNPFTAGGEYQTSQNQTLAGGADAASSSLTNQLQTQAQRTGQNAGAANATAAEAARENERGLSSAEGTANTTRIGDEAGYNQGVLSASEVPAQLEAGEASTDLGAANNALSTSEQASAASPSFWDELSQGFVNGLGQVGAAATTAYCPAEGSLYLMADGSTRAVETLVVGDELAGIDGEPQVIEEIQSALSSVLRVITDNGFTVRNSRVHAFALPIGGFTVAMKSLGKTILTANGSGKVISIEPDGVDRVFNVITDGSHTYRADGVWALGVGEAERQVSMDTWNDIGSRLSQMEVC